jgi:hypothetical protein
MKKCCYSVSLAPRPLWEWAMLRFGYSEGTVMVQLRCPPKVGQG